MSTWDIATGEMTLPDLNAGSYYQIRLQTTLTPAAGKKVKNTVTLQGDSRTTETSSSTVDYLYVERARDPRTIPPTPTLPLPLPLPLRLRRSFVPVISPSFPTAGLLLSVVGIVFATGQLNGLSER